MRQVLASVDPGKRALGAAIFVRPGVGQPWGLVHAYAVEAYAVEGDREHSFLGPMLWRAAAQAVYDTFDGEPNFLAVEGMVIYPNSNSDPRDLLMLQGIAGCLTGLCRTSKCIGMEPRSYKGQVPRDIYGARIEKHLRAAGQWDKVTKPRLATFLNDAMHAVGLGQVVVDRRLPDVLFPG